MSERVKSYEVKVPSADVAQRILALDGRAFKGTTLRVSIAPSQLSAQDIFEWVDADLSSQSISDDFGKSWGFHVAEKRVRSVDTPRKRETEVIKRDHSRPTSPAP